MRRKAIAVPRPEKAAVSAWLWTVAMGGGPLDRSCGHMKKNTASAKVEA